MSGLVTLTDPRSPAAEAYRSLRANLGFARPGEPLRTLAVASPSVTEDGSVALANLAVVTAQAGKRVLVVDADLRRPSQHEWLEVPSGQGLTDVLVGGTALEAALNGTAVVGLQLLPAGSPPPNPAELLASQRMAALVHEVAERFDLVLFDVPPLLPVADGATLAPLLDGVLLVLTARRSRRDQAVRARGVLDNVGARLVGLVLLEADPSDLAYPAYGPQGA